MLPRGSHRLDLQLRRRWSDLDPNLGVVTAGLRRVLRLAGRVEDDVDERLAGLGVDEALADRTSTIPSEAASEPRKRTMSESFLTTFILTRSKAG